MKKHISFPSIEKFSNIVTNINREHNFVGLDENGEAIYDLSKPKPIITFKGTVKLHGTNAGICFNAIDGLWVQSRENIITPESDNAGFAFFVKSNESEFRKLLVQVAATLDSHDDLFDIVKNTISIYGEWCGGNIQKGVGICNLPKSFFIFGVKISPIVDVNDAEAVKKNPAYWVDSSYLRSPEHNIYNIEDYKTYSIDIDFNVPQLSQNKIIEMTLEVENECPVAKAFGFTGIGEGIVFSYMTPDGKSYKFKSKGELHAGKSKVKTLKPVNDEKIRKTLDIVEKVTPTWRLAQMLEKTCDFINGGTLDRAKLGDFIRLVINDIIKEDMDILLDAGLEPKDINRYVSDVARRYFFDQELVK